MTTATAAPKTPAAMAADMETLAQECEVLEQNLGNLKRQRASAQKTFDALTAETETIARSVAKGTAKPETASEHSRKLEQSKAAISGFDSMIRETEKRYSESFPALQKWRTAEAQRMELAEVDSLEADATGIVARIAEILSTVARDDLARYEEVRKRLEALIRIRMGQYPIPAPALKAREAIGRLDKVIASKLGPVRKLWH